MKDAKSMSDAELAAELDRLEIEFCAAREGDGRSGSPGESLYEAMNELETEQKRRKNRFTP